LDRFTAYGSVSLPDGKNRRLGSLPPEPGARAGLHRDVVNRRFRRAFPKLVLRNGFGWVAREAGALRQARLLHAVGNAGAGGADIWVAREGIPVFGHRLATASANAGVHRRFQERTAAMDLKTERLLSRTMG
jgi:hypothetical protein